MAFTASSAANSYYSNVLGLAFSYPAFLGPIIEATGTNLDNQLQDFISFGSTTSAINFWSVNSSTDFYDSQENLFTYSGAAVDGTCSEMNGFDTIDYSVQLTKCNIEQVNETKLAEFEGRYSPLAFIGSDAGSSRFAGAFVQTCSRSWPGLIIFVDENDDARNYQRNVEGLITIVDSISYPSSSQCYSGAGVSY